jgi:hypothetical protein
VAAATAVLQGPMYCTFIGDNNEFTCCVCVCVCVASPPPPETLLGNKLLLYRRQQQRKPLYLYRTRPPPPFYRFLAPVFLFLSLEGRSTSSTVFGTGELRHSPYLFVAFAFFFSLFFFSYFSTLFVFHLLPFGI